MSNDNTAIPGSSSDPALTHSLPHRSNALAIAEGALLIGGLAALDYFGLLPFSMWPVHPYLFVVILLSAQYGIQGGILSALAAIALSHLGGLPVRPIDMSYADYFRVTWANSLSWVLGALTVGLVTSHRSRALQDQAVKLRKAIMAESLIAAQYQVLAQRTHDLERSLAGRADASAMIQVEVTEPAKPVGRAARRRSATHAIKAGQDGPWGAGSPS